MNIPCAVLRHVRYMCKQGHLDGYCQDSISLLCLEVQHLISVAPGSVTKQSACECTAPATLYQNGMQTARRSAPVCLVVSLVLLGLGLQHSLVSSCTVSETLCQYQCLDYNSYYEYCVEMCGCTPRVGLGSDTAGDDDHCRLGCSSKCNHAKDVVVKERCNHVCFRRAFASLPLLLKDAQHLCDRVDLNY